MLWFDGVLVTDPAVLATISGRGEGSLDKASTLYLPINHVRCSCLGLGRHVSSWATSTAQVHLHLVTWGLVASRGVTSQAPSPFLPCGTDVQPSRPCEPADFPS